MRTSKNLMIASKNTCILCYFPDVQQWRSIHLTKCVTFSGSTLGSSLPSYIWSLGFVFFTAEISPFVRFSLHFVFVSALVRSKNLRSIFL